MSNFRDWPKLSETLTGPRDPAHCQSCGAVGSLHGKDEGDSLHLVAWRECDASDHPTKTVIVLCQACSDRIIEPHPRLYINLPMFEPRPGSMQVCANCIFHDSLVCQHPNLKANGGEGLTLIYPKPSVVHVDYARPRRGEWITRYIGPVHCPSRIGVEAL